jgi:hypothetical protein
VKEKRIDKLMMVFALGGPEWCAEAHCRPTLAEGD